MRKYLDDEVAQIAEYGPVIRQVAGIFPCDYMDKPWIFLFSRLEMVFGGRGCKCRIYVYKIADYTDVDFGSYFKWFL